MSDPGVLGNGAQTKYGRKSQGHKQRASLKQAPGVYMSSNLNSATAARKVQQRPKAEHGRHRAKAGADAKPRPQARQPHPHETGKGPYAAAGPGSPLRSTILPPSATCTSPDAAAAAAPKSSPRSGGPDSPAASLGPPSARPPAAVVATGAGVGCPAREGWGQIWRVFGVEPGQAEGPLGLRRRRACCWIGR